MSIHLPPVGTHGRPVETPRSCLVYSSVCSCGLDTVDGPAGPILVLNVAGEIDLITFPLLQQALTAAIDQRPAALVLDMAAVAFCCVRGFALLTTAAATAQRNGTGYAVSGLLPHLDRIATLLWPEHTCVRYRSAAAAITAIRIDQAPGGAGPDRRPGNGSPSILDHRPRPCG